jgi:energy-coupling factor transporter ATP-binding protein EcfA2/energy-coupling factor transporter transmembrane protein EcfT
LRQEKRDGQFNKTAGLPLHVDGIDWRLGDKEQSLKQGLEGEHAEVHIPSSGLRLVSGTITLIMGSNGVGKTTLLEKLAGLRPPEELQVTYGSEPLWQKGQLGNMRLNVEALRQYSYASQSPEEGLFARSLQEELDYSLRPFTLTEEEKEARRGVALSAVGWDSSWLTRDPYLMSGGERRRSALASVFIAPTPWLMLDEPTAGLDGAGHEVIAHQLLKMKGNGVGIVLISHDSDWALPLADTVWLLNPDRSLRVCSRDQLLAFPEWLEETGMKVPQWLEMAHLMWRNGVSADKLWNPLEAASKQAEAWGNRPVQRETSNTQEIVRELEDRQIVEEDHRVGKNEERANLARGRQVRASKQHRLTGFDPRSVWLAYILLSTGLFLLSTWLAVAAGAVVVGSLLVVARISLRRWRGVIVNYVAFSVVTSAVFAVSVGGGSWANYVVAFVGTLFPFVRTMVILLLGLAIPLVMSPLSLRRSLVQMVSFHGKTPQWAERVILIITLMLRFVPVLLALWERFVRNFLARGKTISRNPIALGRRLRDVSLPFLLALFRLGDEVALALESRGVGFHLNPTQATRLKWRLRDNGLVLGAVALVVGLWLFARHSAL